LPPHERDLNPKVNSGSIKRIVVSLLLLALSLILLAQTPPPSQAQSLVLSRVTVVDATGAPAQSEMTVESFRSSACGILIPRILRSTVAITWEFPESRSIPIGTARGKVK
jgi:hypothetical protein